MCSGAHARPVWPPCLPERATPPDRRRGALAPQLRPLLPCRGPILTAPSIIPEGHSAAQSEEQTDLENRGLKAGFLQSSGLGDGNG